MSSPASRWLARPYREGDEDAILELWKAVYPDRTYVGEEWLKWWRWLYRDNPNGPGVITVAEADGKIISHAAEIPLMMRVGGEDVLAAFILDAMTHPDYRRQGALSTLVRMRRAEGERRGIRAAYGFRNKHGYAYPSLAARVNMFDGATMEKVFRPVDWRATMRTQTENRLALALGSAGGKLASAVLFRPRKAPCAEGLTIEQVDRFDERADRLWSRVSGRNRVILVRNQEYLNWRYVDVPDRRYTRLVARRGDDINGFAVFTCAELEGAMTGRIVDVLAESVDVTECLVAAAARRCREGKAALVWSARIAGTPLALAFRRQGFITAPRSKSIVVNGWTTSPELTAELQNAGNWFLQMGDSDEA